MPVRNLLLYLSMATAAVSGCSRGGNTSDSADLLGPTQVATVNGKRLAESVLRVYVLTTARKNLDDATPEERTRFLDELIGVELLRQEAEKSGLAASRTVAAQVELQRMQIIGRAMASSYLQKNPPAAEDLQAIYDENLPRLAGQQFKARHILLSTKEEADQVITQLRNGESFSGLAQERATGPTGPNGGDLGWFTADSMPAPIIEAVRSMQVGSFSSEPIQTDFGYHVLLLDDTRQQTPPSLADVRNELTAAAEREQLDAYLREMRANAQVLLSEDGYSSSETK